jgi:hypothetical protein
MLHRKTISIAVAALVAAILIAGCGGGSESSEPSEPFKPRASLRAIGGTVRTDKPQLVMRVKARPGDANIRSAAVTLPSAVFVDQAAIVNLCSKRELKADDCAGRKRMGFARVFSPAYGGALRGPVYAVSGFGGLPHLAYVLGGPAKVLLRGRIATKGERIQAGVDNVPDTPLRTFELRIDGGKPGYLVLSRNICRARATADAFFTSQDGKSYSQRIPLKASCGA